MSLPLYHLECGQWLHAVAARMEHLMSQESDAARAEVDALKNELAAFLSTHATVVDAAKDAVDDKQALVDLAAEVNVIRGLVLAKTHAA